MKCWILPSYISGVIIGHMYRSFFISFKLPMDIFSSEIIFQYIDLLDSFIFFLSHSVDTLYFRWLGMGTARGRIYSKHPELFRYICDNEDKAWLVQTGLIISHGVKAYLVHAEQVHQIATQQINSHSSKADIEKLKTFKLPYWFLQKV
ncbi:unnamed protein product [Schistosoma margrebowiei]|uniref:Uncharacterized protein n=1 Tax=Schistosoma margrebowiei TaxID=48269 RepID=A0A183MR12_9TREM|nr:unnamed protein product [Schistosoma margrebowiei]